MERKEKKDKRMCGGGHQDVEIICSGGWIDCEVVGRARGGGWETTWDAWSGTRDQTRGEVAGNNPRLGTMYLTASRGGTYLGDVPWRQEEVLDIPKDLYIEIGRGGGLSSGIPGARQVSRPVKKRSTI